MGLRNSLNGPGDTRRSVVAIKDFFLKLQFAFVNKMYSLLRGISICVHVGLEVLRTPKKSATRKKRLRNTVPHDKRIEKKK